jgi:hypothetical protein
MQTPWFVPSTSPEQHTDGQSVSIVQSLRHESVLPSNDVHVDPAAQPDPQPQYPGSVQNPPPFENGWQQPVSQSAFVVQLGRHPLQSAFVLVTQMPLQHCSSFVHAWPRFVHRVWHDVSGAQTRSPVSRRSVQQPVSQSVLPAQRS